MYDLHAHILPGVDDGSRTPEETLEMSRVAAETGTKIILATPHRKDVTEDWSVGHLRRLIADMNAQNAEHSIDVSLVLGMENHLDEALPSEIDAGRALPMNGSRYILVEMPFFGRPDYIERTLVEVQDMGLTPVLAHPERIEAFQEDVELLASFVEYGMLSQVTSGSVVGTWGDEVKMFTHELLDRRLAHVMASDTHSATGLRSPKLGVGMEVAASIVGVDYAKAMVVGTPLAILEDRAFD
jgi:protein-tyrosine phosphatase